MSREYEVLAAFYSEAYPKDTEGAFRYYQYTDLSDDSVFAEYVEQVQKAALYDTGIRAVYEDELLTLSTCSCHTKNGRFVVAARKEGEYGRQVRLLSNCYKLFKTAYFVHILLI